MNRFMEASEKRHDDTNATLRNQQASISNIETRVEQLTKLVHERLILSKSELKPQPHVMEISTEEDINSKPLVILNAATRKPDPQPNEVKGEKKISSAQYS